MPTLIFDIETIPDYTVWSPPKAEEPPPAPANPNGVLPGQLAIVPAAPAAAPGAALSFDIPPAGAPKPRKPRARKAPAVAADGTPIADEPMPPLFACRPVAVGYTVLNDEMMLTNMGVVGTSVYGDDEPRMLRDLGGFIMSMPDVRLVTFSGRTFDMPVLAMRAFRHGVQHSWYTGQHRNRYNEHHLDIFDALTEHGAVQRKGYTLDAFAQAIGLPGKGEMDGSRVHQMFKDKQIEKLESYCLSDAVKTTFVFLRFQLMRGVISDLVYKQSAGYLLEVAKQRKMEGVVFGCDPKRLLLEG